MPAYTWKERQSAEYEHLRWSILRKARGAWLGGGYVGGGGVAEIGPFDKGTS